MSEILFTDVKLYDGSGRPPIMADVAVKDDKIVEIAESGKLNKTGVEVVDGKGKDLVPGFIDVHTHSESTYAREFNNEVGIKGRVFEPVYGLSNKIGGKKQREATAYLYNNPVEKQLSERALDYKWNFLSYAESDCPYSEKLVVRKSSKQMKKCLLQVNFMFNNGYYLNYDFLRECFSKLSAGETNQFVD